MTKVRLLAGIAGLALLAGCGGQVQVGNVATTTNVADSNVMVPEANASADSAVGNTAEAAPAVNLANDELTIVMANGSARHVNFGMARDEAVPMLTAALGAPTATGKNSECGAGPLDNVDYKGGLTLYFQDGKFGGWAVDGRDGGSYATGNGIGIGSTLKEMQAAGEVNVEESSIGHEFTAGGVSGLLSANGPAGKVTDLWAGLDCIMR